MNILKRFSLVLLLALPLAVSAAPRPATPFTDAELDAMLAPIALYPDSVLSHVLIAATVPDDVEAAAEWVDRHPGLRGQEAVDAVERYDWDPSVKALVAFPEVIERMGEDPDWTEDLGLAFLDQEETVMDRVQVLRDRAYDNGTLDDVEHVRVVREREYIYIEPAATRVVYVPYYDPLRVYGAWWWPTYPPHCWTWWAGYPVRHYYGSPFFWGISYHLGPTWYVGAFNWPHRHVVVTRPHRHYAPTPGYTGRSMRRDAVPHETRSARYRSDGWQQDRRSARPVPSPRHDTATRRSDGRRDDAGSRNPSTPRSHRSWTEVRDALASRRAEPSRIERGGGSHGTGTAYRTVDRERVSDGRGRSVVRTEERGSAGARRQDDRIRSYESAPRQPAPESRPSRAEIRATDGERGSRRAGEPQSEPRSEPRGESRSESHGNSSGGGARGGNSGGHGGGRGGDSTRMRSR